MTNSEIKSQAFSLINNVITLKYNVANGCFSDRQEMISQESRIEGIAKWAKANDLLQDFRHYFAAKSFGMGKKFYAEEVSRSFNI